MPPKRATYLTYGNDERCAETRKLIEDAGVVLNVRDISEQPLSERELAELIGHLHISHFLNKMSESYSKHHLDRATPDREEVIKLIAADHTLLRRPIVKSSRLVYIGCDKRKISEMLQIGANGQAQMELPNPPNRSVKVKA
jgi:arsenate reductase-like glutaredoxin family protein